MRRGIMLLIGLGGLCALLTACATGAVSSGGSPNVASATPTTPALNVIALTANDTSSQATSVCGGVFGGSGAPQIVYKLSDSISVEAVYGLPYASYQLPADLPVAPWPLPGAIGSDQLDQQLGGAPNLNPAIGQGAGILLTVCNTSAQPLTLTGAQVAVANFTPATGAVDAWNGCDGAFVRPQGQFGGGCGGAIIADETMSATFAASAGKGATATAAQNGANGQNGFGPLPVTLKPSASIMLLISLTRPSALGTYAFAVSVTTSAAGGSSAMSAYAPLPPQLFALVAHKFTGQACLAAAMQAQIPAQVTNPATYYICPEA
jgi:hypothetical protein